jgi:hypothetical protein
MTLDCRANVLVETLAAVDQVQLPCQMPPCKRPAVFSTVIVREHRSGTDTIRARTCQACDAAFRLDHGYRDSIRLPGPT